MSSLERQFNYPMVKKERILVADDEKELLPVVRTMLSKRDFVVVTSDSSLEALNMINRQDFDLLLTDINMPDVSGMELIRAFRERNPVAGVVVMTGESSLETAVEAMHHGANGFILKLFEMKELVRVINDSLEKRRLEKENIKLKSLLPLFEVSNLLHQSDNIKALLESMVNVVSRETGADSVSIMLKDEEDNLVINASDGLEEGYDKGFRVKVGEGLAGRVAKDGEPLLIRSDDPPDDLSELVRRNNLSSALILPLKLKGENLGVLNITKLSGNLPYFSRGDQDLMSILAGQAASALKNTRLMESLSDLFWATVRTLSKAIDAKSPWTAGHSERVTTWSVMIGREMGLTGDELKNLELAALLHDIGKIGTHESILDKDGKLTDEEFSLMKRHPEDGAHLLSDIKDLTDIMPAIRHHHEWFDGRGYPDGIKEEGIPLMSRIIAVSDAYDAMSSDRPYRKGKARDEIVREFSTNSGTQFDPVVVSVFLDRIL